MQNSNRTIRPTFTEWNPLPSAPTSDLQYGLLAGVTALGSLSVVGAVIWVDRRLPRLMVASGALLLAVGMALVALAEGFVLAGSGMFLSGVGGAFTGSLIFYSAAVQGCVRFKGTLLGALALAFSVGLRDLAYRPGLGRLGLQRPVDQSGHPLVAHGPGARRRCAAVPAAAPAVPGDLRAWAQPEGDPGRSRGQGPDILGGSGLPGGGDHPGRGDTHLRWLSLAMLPDGSDPDFGFRAITLAAGLGALLWGVASDFVPGTTVADHPGSPIPAAGGLGLAAG